MMEGTTHELLRVYFGLMNVRGIKKSKALDEIIRRGVSAYGVEMLINDLLFAVGNAADNRIEEIDAQLDEEEK
jgi:hypothetical protein